MIPAATQRIPVIEDWAGPISRYRCLTRRGKGVVNRSQITRRGEVTRSTGRLPGQGENGKTVLTEIIIGRRHALMSGQVDAGGYWASEVRLSGRYRKSGINRHRDPSRPHTTATYAEE